MTSEKLVQNPDIIDSQIDDEIVMMDVDKGAYFGLDPVGSVIWETMLTPHSIDELVDELVQQYDISREKCQDDVGPFLSRLKNAGLLINAPPA